MTALTIAIAALILSLVNMAVMGAMAVAEIKRWREQDRRETERINRRRDDEPT